MKIDLLRRLICGSLIALSFCWMASAQGQDECTDISKYILASQQALAKDSEDPAKDSKVVAADSQKLNALIDDYVDFTNSPGCFQKAVQSKRDMIQAEEITNAIQAVTPARVPLLNAIEGLSGSQQQGSSLSSSASTNAVTKPDGPTSLLEEFGGASTTTGTSSMTFQWSPGTALRNVVLSGYDDLCDFAFPSAPQNPTGPTPKPKCINKSLISRLTPLTFKVTSNTSTATKTLSGTASSSSSTSTSQPVTVSSKGNSGPSFAGLTVQYSFYGSKSKATTNAVTKALTTPSPDIAEAADKLITNMQETMINLDQCDVYRAWQSSAKRNLTNKIASIRNSTPALTVEEQTTPLQSYVEGQYVTLLVNMLKSDSCKPAIQGLPGLYGSIVRSETADVLAPPANSAKPEVAIEYDLNTPTSQPDYSSVKLTGNWQFAFRSAAAKPAPGAKQDSEKPHVPAEPGAGAPAPKKEKDVTRKNAASEYAKQAGTILASAKSGNLTDTTKQLTASAKQNAQDSANAKPWSLTATSTVDIYNFEPPSTVPSATHLRDFQAGVELSRLWAPQKDSSALRKFAGSITTAAAYSYQDQTSPAMLTGPALSDFTGLPSSTKTAYAQRGVIQLGQVRLGLGTGKNITYPIAFTYSNRTELIVHSTWRAQFGITYNFNSLFSSSNPAPASTAKTPAASGAE